MANASKSFAPDPPRAVVSSGSVLFRYAAESDAAQILQLRRGPSQDGRLAATTDDEGAQRLWLRGYLRRHAEGLEHYFMICGRDGRTLGTVRVHDVAEASCWWGSWVLAPHTPVAATLESYILVNCFMFERLYVNEARFRVRAANVPVVRFHDAMRSPRVSASGEDLEYRVDAGWYGALKRKYAAHFLQIDNRP
jgi:hypothetical protein